MKREYYSVDEDGYILDVHVLDPEEDVIPFNCKLGWGSGIHTPRYDHSLGQWVEDKTKDEFLTEAKEEKDQELNAACKNAILAGFTHEINGQVYWFSYDHEAQGNFRDANFAFADGIITEMPWTVRIGGQDGKYTRIVVDYTTLRQLNLAILRHKSEKIGKYRDFLMPIVESALTVDEVKEVTWDAVPMESVSVN